MPAALLLDMDDTLCDTRGADLLATTDFAAFLAGRFGAAAEPAAAEYLARIYAWRDEPRLAAALAGIDDERARRVALLGLVLEPRLGRHVPQADVDAAERRFMDLRMRHFAFFPGVEALLGRLRGRYRLGVVSNGPVYSQHPKLARTGLSERVDLVLLGGELPWQKPHPAIFRLACERLGVAPAEALFVGDHMAADVAGALGAGLQAAWISAGRPRPPEAPAAPFLVLETILDLEGALDRPAGTPRPGQP